MSVSGNEDITSEWVEWARKKADWYDPSIATEDKYLGKRQHEKNTGKWRLRRTSTNFNQLVDFGV